MSKHVTYSSPGCLEEKYNDDDNKMEKGAKDKSVMNAIAECQQLLLSISNPLNDELKQIISKHVEKLRNSLIVENEADKDESRQKYKFTGYEKNPNDQITAVYDGEIILDCKNGIITGQLQEKETLYSMQGIFDIETNNISKLTTEPFGEYQHLNENNKHLAGHWDTCIWIDGKIDFENKTIICKNQRWHNFIEVLQFK